MSPAARRIPASLSASTVAAAALCALVVGAGGACTNFDQPERLEDTRVLGVRTEPAEILYSPLHLLPAAERPPFFPLPPIDVEVEVFAFDPRGGRMSTSVQLCPANASDSTCRLFDAEQAVLAEPPAARPDLRALLSPRSFEGDISDDALSQNPAGPVPMEPVALQFTPPVIDFFIPDDRAGVPVPSIFPLLPRIVIETRNLDQEAPEVTRERAFKRIPVALDLTSPNLPPEIAGDLARRLGIELCAAPISQEEYAEQGRAACLERRAANNNPALAGFLREAPEGLEDDPFAAEGVLTTDDVAPDVPPRSDLSAGGDGEEEEGDVIRASPGEELRFLPIFSPETVERYQVVSFDVESSTIFINNRIEDIACTWYATRGAVSDGLTAEQFTKSLTVSWTLPTEVEAGERDTLVLVVLDQRGGTAYGEVVVEYN